jgi:anti-anti-sigma factor
VGRNPSLACDGVFASARIAPAGAETNSMAVFVPVAQLDIETSTDDERCLVAVRGEIDLSNVGALETRLRRISSDEIVLDLSGVDYIDCSGVALLFRTAGRLTLGAVSSAVDRVLRLCDFETAVG